VEGQATVLPVMAAGKLNVPRMYLQFVFVTPHGFEAKAQISQPEALAGIAPS